MAPCLLPENDVVAPQSIRSGELESLLSAFADAGESLYADDTHAARPSGSRTRALLDPRHPTVRRCQVRLFIDERAPARVAAIVNPRLVEDGSPVGLLGFFEAADDAAAAGRLLAEATAWLYAQGCGRVRGPMNFTTWHDYRFVTEGEAGWIPGEPYHHRYYPRLWEASGFAAAGRYASHWVADIDAVLARFAARAELATASGVSLRPVEPGDLPALYRLAVAGFADNWQYSPIDPEEFAALYSGERSAAGAATSYVAVAGGAPIGFYYTFRAVLPAGETSIGKTIVVDAGQRDRGVYHLMMSAWLREAKAAVGRAIAALFHCDGSPALMGWERAGAAFKRYALYEHQRA